VARGALKICAWDDETRELAEIVSTGDAPADREGSGALLARVFDCRGRAGDARVLRKHGCSSPDEVRRACDDPAIDPASINGRAGGPR